MIKTYLRAIFLWLLMLLAFAPPVFALPSLRSTFSAPVAETVRHARAHTDGNIYLLSSNLSNASNAVCCKQH